MKKCLDCNATKTLAEFYKNKAMPSGVCSYCKPCDKMRKNRLRRKWVKTGNEGYKRARRNNKLMSRYGITQDTYEAMVISQGGLCKICNIEPEKGLVVDHCHSIGAKNPDAIRGLLCNDCNMMLGSSKDSTLTLHNAIDYLRNFYE
jgi:hypothetical protein